MKDIYSNLAYYNDIRESNKDSFLDNNFIKNLKTGDIFSYRFLDNIKKEKNRSFLLNKNSTINDIATDIFPFSVFITLTSSVQPNFRDLSDELLVSELSFNKVINDNFNSFFRSFFKYRIFKTFLRAENRLYISVNEFTKKLTLHRHFLQYLKTKEDTISYISSFLDNYELRSDLNFIGRTEIVVSDIVYNDLKIHSNLKEITLSKNKVLVLLDSNIKSGRFLYIKRIKKNKDNNNSDSKILTKYIMKYVFKNVFDSDNLSNFQKSCKYLHSTLNIRRFNYSRFMFPRYLYDNLVLSFSDSDNDINIYDMYSLKDLTYFKNSGKFYIAYDNSTYYPEDICYLNCVKSFCYKQNIPDSYVLDIFPNLSSVYNCLKDTDNYFLSQVIKDYYQDNYDEFSYVGDFDFFADKDNPIFVINGLSFTFRNKDPYLDIKVLNSKDFLYS